MSDATAVPLLHACVSCGIPVQSGDGPGELAWHDCEWVTELASKALPPPPPPEPGLEALIRIVTQQASARAEKMSAREMTDLLRSAADLIRAQNEGHHGEAQSGGGASLKLLAFVAKG